MRHHRIRRAESSEVASHPGPRASRGRGYDSAGIALLENDGPRVRPRRREPPVPEAGTSTNGSGSTTGLGHTRWATHGAVTEGNAHPLTACEDGQLAIVLNGIVENYRELKEALRAAGHGFSSETDAETVAHLIEGHYDGDLTDAVVKTYDELEGHFTSGSSSTATTPASSSVRAARRPSSSGSARRELPRLQRRRLPRRDAQRGLPRRRRHRLDHPRSVEFVRADGKPVEHEPLELDWDDESAEKGGYETFMLKEIYEQPESIAETIGDRTPPRKARPRGFGMDDRQLADLRRIVILACGTAYHAGVVGRYVLEEWARIPGRARHRLRMDLPQSGDRREHAGDRDLAVGRDARHGRGDAAGAREGRPHGGDHEHDGLAHHARGRFHLYTRCGLEVGVAASKTFTSQVALLYLVGLKLAEMRGTLPPQEISYIVDQVYTLPKKVARFLDGDHPIEEIAQRFYQQDFFLYLGRHIGLPVALEGALKLKEISYIPTEAYSAGEMKHGPIALLEEGTPVVVVATNIHVYDKIVSNIQETRARGAHVIAIATDGTRTSSTTPTTSSTSAHAVVPAGGARRRAPAAARVPNRASPWPECRPAAEPGEDRHRRITRSRDARGGSVAEATRDVCGLLGRQLLLAASGASYALVFVAFLLYETPGLGSRTSSTSRSTTAIATGPLIGALAGFAATGLYAAAVVLNPTIPSTDVLTASTAIRAITSCRSASCSAGSPGGTGSCCRSFRSSPSGTS